jgi:hypothetical protein
MNSAMLHYLVMLVGEVLVIPTLTPEISETSGIPEPVPSTVSTFEKKNLSVRD